MNSKDKVKAYDKIRNHVISAEKALGAPPPIKVPYLPDVRDFDSVRGYYKALKESAVESSEWYAREKEISQVRYIFELAGEDMHGTA